MMAYVINNSPDLKSKKKKENVPPEPPSYLVLMPFQPPVKLFFEHIKMGQEAKRILKIRNPSDNPINVILDKLPDPKIGMVLSHTEFTVDKSGEFIIEITFKPLLEGSSRECIHVKDANKNKKVSDIFINWNSINPNPQKIKKKKPLALETKILTQNKVIGKKTYVKNADVPKKPLWKSSYGYPSVNNSTTVKAKRPSAEVVEDLPPCNFPGSPIRRQTYNVEDKENLDTNCGIYSNKQKRSPRLGRDTVLTPLPLITTGRLKTKPQNKHEDNYDRYSISSATDPKVKQVQTIRNLQVSEDILHLGPSDNESDGDVVCLGNETFRKQNNQDRRDTYFVNQTTHVKHTLPSQKNQQDRRNTYHVDFHNGLDSNVYAQPIISDVEFTGHMFIEEEEIRETKITRTPLHRKGSSGKRGSWGEGDTSYENPRRNSIELVNGKMRIKKSSMGKLYNEFRRRSIDRFSIDSLEAVEDVKVDPVDGNIFEQINFDNITISSPIELPDSFNPRRTSTDLKQQKKNLKNPKQSKKKMEFVYEPSENVSEKVNNAFDESIHSLKSTTHDMFASLFNGMKPFEDIGNLSGISSIKSGDALHDRSYLSECAKEEACVTQDHHMSKGHGQTYTKDKITDNTYTKQKQLSSETFTQEKQLTSETFVQEKQTTSETFVQEKQTTSETFIQEKGAISETFIKEKPAPPSAWGETFHELKANVTYQVPCPDLNDAITPPPQDEQTATSADVPDHIMHNPLKSLNEKISSIEFSVIRCEQKHANTVSRHDAGTEPQSSAPDTRLASIPESNESKLPDATYSSDSFHSANESESPNPSSSTPFNEKTEDKPTTAWSIEISSPSKGVVEEKKQAGSYDFLVKYPQTRPVTRTIKKPNTSRMSRSVPSSTPKVNNKTAGESLSNIKSIAKAGDSPNETKNTNKSFNSSTSSSDRSKNSSSDLLDVSARSVSRKRRSNTNDAAGEKKKGQGPPPGKLLRTSSQDVFKKPVPKPSAAVRPPSVRKAAGLPMKSLSLTKKKKQREESVQFYNPEKIISDYTDSNLLIATSNSSTPFSVGSLYMDPKVLDDLERDNIKWMNSLLTPPIELECDAEGLWCVDIADLWLKSSRAQTLELAPSREKTAMKYHGQQDRLDALRKAAFQLFRSASMSPVLSKLSWHISKNLIEVRKDRDLHLDQGLHQRVISLLLCYNPLWLRIGLEAVYGCTVPLHHNNDVLGLTSFMRKHLVNDPYTRKQHSHPKVPNLMDATFADAMKKFILRKFLMVVYFLDRAKTTKLIRHDPCLFNKKAKYKDSAQLVIEFSRDLISGGDILRHLRTIDYVLEHRQTYLNEFDFSTQSLLDLRDGVRLARAMEIIVHQKHLTKRLRAPAISRLQKVHNVEISLSALQDAGYDIQDDITAKDIADGHREKTLSLLWQIIYKFQAPRYDQAARSIQRWWKGKSLFREIRRRIRSKLMAKQNSAATVLQSKWKGILTRRKFVQLKNNLKVQKAQRLSASVVIQKFFRRHQDRTRYLQLKSIALKLQRNYRRNKRVNTDRETFLRMKKSCVTIQRFWRNYKVNQKYRQDYERVKTAAVVIQKWFRGSKRVREERARYLTLRHTVVTCQRRYRATKEMVKTRDAYILMKQSAVLLQRKYRAHRAMLAEREHYTKLRAAAVEIQRRFRSKQVAKTQRQEYLQMKHAALVIQRKYRANKAMVSQREKYVTMKQATLAIQRYWRSCQLMKSDRASYVELRERVVLVQRQYRATKQMIVAREHYKQVLRSILCIQRRYRAYVAMRKAKVDYTRLRQACVMVQQRYRAQKCMQAQRRTYLQQRQACLVIQERYRSYRVMQQCRSDYVNLRNNTILIQNLWRSKLSMRRDQAEFCRVKSKAVVIQTYFRSYLLMKKQRQEYVLVRHSVVKIQEWYRNVKLVRETRDNYLEMKQAVVTLQTRYRALLAMRRDRHNYTELRSRTIVIQQHVRAYLLMKRERSHYNRLKSATIRIQRTFRNKRYNRCATKIQNYYRGYRAMLAQREALLRLKQATITIQSRYRAQRLMRQERDAYANLKQACVSMQQRWRANAATRKQRAHYVLVKQKTVLIQQWYRNLKITKLEAKYLQELKQSTLTVQRRFRANLAMRKQRAEYVRMRDATLTIQTRFRSYVIARNQRAEYLELKQAVLNVQKRFRATKQMRVELDAYTRLRHAALTIQTHYREYARMKAQRQAYLQLKQAVRTVEARYVANKMMRTQREAYVGLKRAVCVLETRYQARLAMKQERQRYLAMKSSVCRIEQWYLAKRVATHERQSFLELRFFTIMIQRRFRFKINLRKYERVIELLKLKREEKKREQHRQQCATKIQSLWKMYQVRKKYGPILEQKRQEKKSSDKQVQSQTPLYIRMEEAIQVLNVGTDLYCVMMSLYNLDTITMLSPKLCVDFTNKGLIPMLYQYLQSVNRSEPNKIMAISILRVFINLARFDLTAPILWKVTLMVDGLNTIVDLIKIWYTKNEELMCAATTLLWLFTMKADHIGVITSTENLSKKLLYVFTQLDKKKPTRKPSGPLILPGAKADWGLGYRRKVFTDPLYAVSTLCQKLGLVGAKGKEDTSRVSSASTGMASRLRNVKSMKHSF